MSSSQPTNNPIGNVAEHALGQITGDRGDLGVGVAQIEDQAGRATRRRGGQLRLGGDDKPITHDKFLAHRDGSPAEAGAEPAVGRAAASTPSIGWSAGTCGKSVRSVGLVAVRFAAPGSPQRRAF
jgi:hypothetical protein